MSKLTKLQAKAHAEAEKLLTKDRLTDDERLFVIDNWQESARHINSIAGAFFTPWGLARDLSIEVGPGRLIDLCAGIGTLSLACAWRLAWPHDGISEIVCVEMNPDYAAVGRKIVPEARWIVGDIFNLPNDLGRFVTAIGNPPFGKVKRSGKAPRYTGQAFELHAIDIASDLADHGVFIVPQMTAGFKYSGCPNGGWPETRRDGIGSGYVECRGDEHAKLQVQTGIVLKPNCGIDTSAYAKDWHGVSVTIEVVLADFVEARERREAKVEPAVAVKPRPRDERQPQLFDEVAT